MSVTPFSPIRNNATGITNTGISSVGTDLVLTAATDVTKFPDAADGQFWATLHANVQNPTVFETVLALRTVAAGSEFTIVRNQDGTTSPAAGWPSGTVFAMYINRGKALEWESRMLTHTHNGTDSVDIGVSSIVSSEVPGGAIDGSNTSYTTAAAFLSGTLRVYRDGLRLKGGGIDFTEGANLHSFTMVTAPPAGNIVLIDYHTQSSVLATGSTSLVYHEVPTGLVNGSNTVFTTGFAYVGGTVEVFVNGLQQKLVTDYAETSAAAGTITMTVAPLTGATVWMHYQKSVSVLGNAATLNGFGTSTVGTASTIPVLASTAKLPNASLGNIYRCRVWCSTAQSITTGVITKVLFDTAVYDSNSNFDTATNHRYTAPVAGFYLITTNISVNTTATNQRTIAYIYKNGASVADSASSTGVATTNDARVTDIVQLAAGDYIEGYIYQDAGGSKALGNFASDTFMSIHLLST